ncbi:zinc finger matrin-type protein CG9776 isoform X1 [Drosophila tropicalis]|uniref:zinc finger matrin-type protein CG9776 isoform X1 n=1 Tax=Drosophila tropicalis TaxID=46794 RepID=UPI0035AB7EB4
MDDDMVLNPGPPGVDNNAKSEEKNKECEKETTSSKAGKSRRRSTSRRRSNSRRRSRSLSRSPTPPRRGRYGSPEYGRFDRRRRFAPRRSPDRRRSPPWRRSPIRRGRSRRGRSRSRSRSNSPAGAGRWSPKKKPASPPLPRSNQPPAQMSTGYNVMPPQMYQQPPYGAAPDVVYHGHQYGMPQPNAFASRGPPGYVGMQGPPPSQPNFNTAYGPPGTWGVNEYGQQVWLPQPQLTTVPPPVAPESALVSAQQTTVAPPPQQQQPPGPQQLIDDGQKPPALEGAGLPPQDAVAQEAENQKDELKKQRANYVKKVLLLKKEMKVLKEQREDLAAGAEPPTPTTSNFIEENDRLQVQIKKKLDTIENVIDMLNGIIGDEEPEDEQRRKPLAENATINSKEEPSATTSSDSSGDSSDSDSSTSSSSDSSSDDDGDDDDNEDQNDGTPTDRLKDRAIKSMKAKQQRGIGENISATTATSKAAGAHNQQPVQSYNFVFFDPEQHWCDSCGVFPKTARDYLKHLHTEEHMNRDIIETPWHVEIDHDPFPTYENAPTKRVPVRGMQFLVPANAWFCKLCSVWIGDLHCASAHLKSRLHSNRYELYLKKTPNYETNWFANRDRAIQQQKDNGEVKNKKTKKDEETVSKKRKKKSDKKKKKHKHGKNKHKRSTSSSSDSSSSEDEKAQQPKKGRTDEQVDKLSTSSSNVSNNGSSIRVSMRKQESSTERSAPLKPEVVVHPVAPPPPIIKDALNSDGRGKWTSAGGEEHIEDQKNRDEAMLQQWNTVQPVISESEKKLLEQLKGKLKSKTRDHHKPSTSGTNAASDDKLKRSGGGSNSTTKRRTRSRSRPHETKRRTRSRSGSRGRLDRDRRDRERDRDRDRARDRERERERDRDRDRDRRRSRSRSRSRGRRRFSRSPLRGSRRSRSREARRRRSSRSPSHSEDRVERPVVKHSEFRPRAQPNQKSSESKRDKKETTAKPKVSKTSASSSGATTGGKKLPFIGKMPVFKKQPTASAGVGDNAAAAYTNGSLEAPPPPPPAPLGGVHMAPAVPRLAAPTVAQIQMAMMEDAYGNAPPFHPDAGMMVDYDELMPDPVQFANLMSHVPPPPPPGDGSDGDTIGKDSDGNEQQAIENDEEDVLPPGIDEAETDLVPQPLDAADQPRDGELPKDLAEALDIIFPTDGVIGEVADEASQIPSEPQTVTTIMEDTTVLSEHNLLDLANQGIHLVTIDETSTSSPITTPTEATVPTSAPAADIIEEPKSLDSPKNTLTSIQGEQIPLVNGKSTDDALTRGTISVNHTDAIDIPMPGSPQPPQPLQSAAYIADAVSETKDMEEKMMDLEDISKPTESTSDLEKMRHQAELDELAMLGIDSSDMAAQYAL